ncbi:F-box only protein 6-like [Oratosquilla oratoria]|uniref:F-box only protein 6-like n=1 Tax=Oratosquilla oratoria TaxID=337810 RepID=UPI003F75F637
MISFFRDLLLLATPTDSSDTNPMDIPDGNGLVLGGVLVPVTVLEEIFSYLESRFLINKVSHVCQQWNRILTNCLFWIHRLDMEGSTIPLPVRQSMMDHSSEAEVCRNLQKLSVYHTFNRNVLVNSSGANKFKGWRVSSNGMIVESPPVGSQPIPEEANLPSQHCFVGTYFKVKRYQKVDFKKEGITPWVLKVLQPKIEISEWVSARFDCGATHNIEVHIYVDGSWNPVWSHKWCSETGDYVRTQWVKIRHVLTDYPHDAVSLMFSSSSKDTQFWAGNYGSKSAGSSVVFRL